MRPFQRHKEDMCAAPPIDNKKRTEREIIPPCPLLLCVTKLRFFFRCPRIPFLEPFHPARAVDELLLTGIKRVAIVANFNVRAFNGGAGFYHVPAGARKRHRLVFRMNFIFHVRPLKKLSLDCFVRNRFADSPL
jgi:hypothetical protein